MGDTKDISNEKYFCAGRFCTMREQCHRHVSSVQVNNAQFEDYDLVKLRDQNCKYFIDIKEVAQQS